MLKSNASSPNAVLFPEFTVAADFCIQTLCVCVHIYIYIYIYIYISVLLSLLKELL